LVLVRRINKLYPAGVGSAKAACHGSNPYLPSRQQHRLHALSCDAWGSRDFGAYFASFADVRFARVQILAHLHNLHLCEDACRFNPNLVLI
jgi:hypothetical protein